MLSAGVSLVSSHEVRVFNLSQHMHTVQQRHPTSGCASTTRSYSFIAVLPCVLPCVQAIPFLMLEEVRRKDWMESFAHHVVTLGLMYYRCAHFEAIP